MSVADVEETIDQQQAFIEENIASSDPTKVSAALVKIINFVVQGDGDVTVFSDLFAKHAFVPNMDKSLKLLAYVTLRYIKLNLAQWEKISGFFLTDLNTNDLDIKTAVLKVFEYAPYKILLDLIGAGIVNVTSYLHFEDAAHAEEASLLRCTAASVVTSLLIFRKTLRQNNNFNVAAWSALTERILTDSSRRVVRKCLEAVYILFSDVYRSTGYHGIEREEKAAATQALLQKYVKVVITKLTPNMDMLLRRLQWLDGSGKYFVLFPLVCVIANVAETNWTNTNPKIGFITSPRHFVVEVIERELLPFLVGREEAHIVEAGSCIAFLVRKTDINKPAWILAVCNAYLGLLGRESARSVARRIMTEFFSVLDLLPLNLMQPVVIRALQQIEVLQLTSIHARLTFVNRSFNAIIRKVIALSQAQAADSPASKENIALQMIEDMINHNWVQSMLKHSTEEPFYEEVWTTLMRQILHAYLKRTDELMENPEGDGDVRNIWKDPLYIVTLAGTKVLGWKCHLRTYGYEMYLKCLDTICHALQTGSKSHDKHLATLLGKALDNVPQIKSDPIALRVVFIVSKHAPATMPVKHIDAILQLVANRFLSWLHPADKLAQTVTASAALPPPLAAAEPAKDDKKKKPDDKKVSAKTDDKKTAAAVPAPPPVPVPPPLLAATAPTNPIGATTASLTGLVEKGQLGYKVDQLKKASQTDIELIALVLQILASHPVLTDETKRAVLKQQIGSLATAKAGDIFSFQHFKSLQTSDTTYRSYLTRHLTATGDVAKIDIGTLLPPHTRSFVPPVEYLDKNIVDKHPDDEFLIQSCKIQLSMAKRQTKSSAYGSYLTITAPSDPILVRLAYMLLDDCGVCVSLELTNITRVAIPKMIVFLNLSGRLESTADNPNFIEFTNIQPGQLIESQTKLHISAFALNSIHTKILLVPALDKPATLDINCLPYRLNIHQLFKPWLIDYAEFLRQWNRFPNSFSFLATLADKSQIRGIATKIRPFHHCVIDWDYAAEAFFQAAFAALTWWDENALFTINATVNPETEGLVLRFEVRSASLSLLLLLDHHKEEWLRDLVGGTAKLLADTAHTAASAASWGTNEYVTPFDNTKPTKYSQPYSEESVLDKWQSARQSLAI